MLGNVPALLGSRAGFSYAAYKKSVKILSSRYEYKHPLALPHKNCILFEAALHEFFSSVIPYPHTVSIKC